MRKRRRLLVLGAFASVLALVAWGGGSMLRMPGRSYSGSLEPLTAAQTALSERLKAHVGRLAGDIGERNVWRPAELGRAADFVEAAFEQAGYSVERQAYEFEGTEVRNLIAELPGQGNASGEIVILGAHYDSAPGTPGANDNASGVAALIEMARMLHGAVLSRTVRFVAFVNEEPPFFQTDAMGSVRYARLCRERGENVAAMLALETIGYYRDERGSQRYPFPFSVAYPDTGNFVAFVGNMKSGALVRRVVGSFRRHAKFPSEGAAVPGWIAGIGWSDHWAFWKEGYRALMVTDTAPFRYPHYHSHFDTPDRIDYDRLARVVDGLVSVVAELARGKREGQRGS